MRDQEEKKCSKRLANLLLKLLVIRKETIFYFVFTVSKGEQGMMFNAVWHVKGGKPQLEPPVAIDTISKK